MAWRAALFFLLLFLVVLLHRLIRVVGNLFLQFRAWRKGYAGFNLLNVEGFFRQRTLARQRKAHRAELAELYAETVAQVAGQTVYEVRQHVFDVASRQRRPPGNVLCNVFQRLAPHVHGVRIKLAGTRLRARLPLFYQLYFHCIKNLNY